jgi:hypothetical protein
MSRKKRFQSKIFPFSLFPFPSSLFPFPPSPIPLFNRRTKMRNVTKVVLLVCTALTALAFASCQAIADTSGLIQTPETVWVSLTPTVPAVDGKGVRTATLTLDFSRAIDGLTSETSAEDLEKIFAFEYKGSTSSGITATEVKKSVVGIYTLSMENVPDDDEGIVLVTIKKSGIAPATRLWALNGEVVSNEDLTAALQSFKFERSKNAALSEDVVGGIDHEAGTVVVVAPIEASRNSLIPTITTNPGNTYEPKAQTNFSGDVLYTISAAKSIAIQNQKTYTVSVTQRTLESASILFFGFTKQENSAAGITDSVSGVIDEDATPKTISVTVPAGTNVSKLKPNIIHSGAGIVPANLASHDFTNPVSWTVTPVSGAPIVYVVTVTQGAPPPPGPIDSGEFGAAAATGGSNDSVFNAVAKDADGNTYAVGYQSGTGVFSYGAFSVTGSSEVANSLIVKYDSAGTVLWAQTVHPSVYNPQDTENNCFTLKFNGVAVDGSGVYAVGSQPCGAYYNYGNSKTGFGTCADSAVIVKYNSEGAAQWVKVSNRVNASSSDYAHFYGASADGLGSVYAVGGQQGPYQYDYDSKIAQGTSIDRENSVIVKYNSATGAAQWAKSVNDDSIDNSGSVFYGVAADSNGNVLAAGFQIGNAIFDYDGATATGSADAYVRYANAVIVKYNGASGAALWAQSTSEGAKDSSFRGVAVDGSGNVYAAGFQTENGAFTYSGKTVFGNYLGGKNAVIVKYDSAGGGLWAKSLSVSPNESVFYGVAADALGNVYAAGHQTGTGPFNYDTASPAPDYAGGDNAVIVKYNSAGGIGAAQWAGSVTGGGSKSQFYGIAADGIGGFSAVGYQNGTGTFDYGDDKTAAGTVDHYNAVAVGYR